MLILHKYVYSHFDFSNTTLEIKVFTKIVLTPNHDPILKISSIEVTRHHAYRLKIHHESMSSVTISKYRNEWTRRLISCMFSLAVAWKVLYSRRLNKLKLSQERNSESLIFYSYLKTYVHQSIYFLPSHADLTDKIPTLFVTKLTPRILSSLSADSQRWSNHPPPT